MVVRAYEGHCLAAATEDRDSRSLAWRTEAGVLQCGRGLSLAESQRWGGVALARGVRGEGLASSDGTAAPTARLRRDRALPSTYTPPPRTRSRAGGWLWRALSSEGAPAASPPETACPETGRKRAQIGQMSLSGTHDYSRCILGKSPASPFLCFLSIRKVAQNIICRNEPSSQSKLEISIMVFL